VKPTTLRLRLFAASFASIFLALLIAGFSIASLFSNHVETNLTKDLTSQFDRLISLIDATPSSLALHAPLADPAFAKPYGGLYWQITDIKTNERIRSRSMWDAEFTISDDKLLDGKLNETRLLDPEGTPAITLVQRLVFELNNGSIRTLDIIMAEDLLVFYQANAKFRSDLALSLFFLALILSLAAWVQIALGLAPLAKIKQEVNAIRSGSTKRLSKSHPPEVMPLISEVNELLDNQEKSISYARTRASNLAHGLKTSLTILGVQANDIRKNNNNKTSKTANIIEKTTNDMSAIIDHQLRLSRLNTRSRKNTFTSSLLKNITSITKALKLTPNGEKIKWHLDIDDSLFINIDEPDLLELLGIIIENASIWAKDAIFISNEIEGNSAVIIIEDNGLGLTQQQISAIGKRGIKLDSKGSGTGIGLSIASEIVEMNSGEFQFSKSKRGGLKVEIKLPMTKN